MPHTYPPGFLLGQIPLVHTTGISLQPAKSLQNTHFCKFDRLCFQPNRFFKLVTHWKTKYGYTMTKPRYFPVLQLFDYRLYPQTCFPICVPSCSFTRYHHKKQPQLRNAQLPVHTWFWFLGLFFVCWSDNHFLQNLTSWADTLHSPYGTAVPWANQLSSDVRKTNPDQVPPIADSIPDKIIKFDTSKFRILIHPDSVPIESHTRIPDPVTPNSDSVYGVYGLINKIRHTQISHLNPPGFQSHRIPIPDSPPCNTKFIFRVRIKQSSPIHPNFTFGFTRIPVPSNPNPGFPTL